MEYANGAFRQVELHKDYVVKSVLVDGGYYDSDSYDSECDATPEECMASQVNELGVWHDFPNNGALCPILAHSTVDDIYMPRAITLDDDPGYHIKKWLDPKYDNDISEYFPNGLSVFSHDQINSAITVMSDFAHSNDIGEIGYKGFLKGLSEILAKKATVFYNIIEDLHVHNVGILDKELVVIDYAGVEPVY